MIYPKPYSIYLRGTISPVEDDRLEISRPAFMCTQGVWGRGFGGV